MGVRYRRFNWQTVGCGLLGWALAAVSVFAQGPPPLQIEASAPGPAMAGQELLYTLTLVNNGQSPLKDVVVRARTPRGTTYLEAGQMPGAGGWASGGLARGEQGDVYWFRMEGDLPPGRPQALYLKVQVALTGVDEVALDDYAASQTANGPAVAGKPLRTEVVRPTPAPTPTSTPQPTLTPLPAPTPIPLTLPPAQPRPAAPSPPANPGPGSAPPTPFGMWAIVGLGVVIIVVVAIGIGMGRLKKL